MIEIQLSLHRKARIWIDEFPDVCIKNTSSIKENLPILNSFPEDLENGCFVVEIFIPLGARVSYGLLGAEFIVHPDDTFIFEVYSSNRANTTFESVNKIIDKVRVGLPLIYSESVKRGVLQYFSDKKKSRPKGTLVFKWAAYDEVSSNEVIFEHLASIICSYFFSNKKFKNKEDYLNLFVSVF